MLVPTFTSIMSVYKLLLLLNITSWIYNFSLDQWSEKEPLIISNCLSTSTKCEVSWGICDGHNFRGPWFEVPTRPNRKVTTPNPTRRSSGAPQGCFCVDRTKRCLKPLHTHSLTHYSSRKLVKVLNIPSVQLTHAITQLNCYLMRIRVTFFIAAIVICLLLRKFSSAMENFLLREITIHFPDPWESYLYQTFIFSFYFISFKVIVIKLIFFNFPVFLISISI